LRCGPIQIDANGENDVPIVDWSKPEPFIYRDEQGKAFYRNVRYPLPNADRSPRITGKGKQDKTFIRYRPDGKGGWWSGLDEIEPIPYGLFEFLGDLQTEQTIEVYVVEGERKADRLRKLGLCAISVPQGSRNFGHLFRGRNVSSSLKS
jgi:hypothetical protein